MNMTVSPTASGATAAADHGGEHAVAGGLIGRGVVLLRELVADGNERHPSEDPRSPGYLAIGETVIFMTPPVYPY